MGDAISEIARPDKYIYRYYIDSIREPGLIRYMYSDSVGRHYLRTEDRTGWMYVSQTDMSNKISGMRTGRRHSLGCRSTG